MGITLASVDNVQGVVQDVVQDSDAGGSVDEELAQQVSSDTDAANMLQLSTFLQETG